MTSTQKGAVRLFRVLGIDVFLHWSWLVVAVYQIGQKQDRYSSIGWSIAEYLALFLMVLLHEFGHALACRQVGGKADRIMLWPLGGVAYIAPPPRPGALLWSIVAGPLVNLVLLFPLFGTYLFLKRSGWDVSPDALQLMKMITAIDLVLLVFNLIPVYPLDGGQIVRALLWFPFGPARSLSITTAVGFVGAIALAGYAFVERSLWTGVIAFFIFMRCMAGWKSAKLMKQMAGSPVAADSPVPPAMPRRRSARSGAATNAAPSSTYSRLLPSAPSATKPSPPFPARSAVSPTLCSSGGSRQTPAPRMTRTKSSQGHSQKRAGSLRESILCKVTS